MRLAFALALLVVAVAARAEPCRPLTAMTLEPDWYGGMTVPMVIGGRPLALLVDTGGVRSMLTHSTVSDLDLIPRPIRGERVTLYGGEQVTQWVRANATPDMPSSFYVMPDNRVPYALAGTLAPDYLSQYDVDFDFLRARMSLFAPGVCSAEGATPLLPDPSHHLVVMVDLDGQKLPAMLDTGASRSDFSLETARRLFGPGLTESPARRADCESGLATHPFHKLTIGGVTVDNPDLVLVPDAIGRRPSASPRLVLGMGVLRRLHLTVFYRRGVIAVARATP